MTTQIQLTDHHSINALNKRLIIEYLPKCASYFVRDANVNHAHVWFHQGPLDEDGKKTTKGVSIESVLLICAHRLQTHQDGPQACGENDVAIMRIMEAIDILQSRARRRHIDAILKRVDEFSKKGDAYLYCQTIRAFGAGYPTPMPMLRAFHGLISCAKHGHVTLTPADAELFGFAARSEIEKVCAEALKSFVEEGKMPEEPAQETVLAEGVIYHDKAKAALTWRRGAMATIFEIGNLQDSWSAWASLARALVASRVLLSEENLRELENLATSPAAKNGLAELRSYMATCVGVS